MSNRLTDRLNFKNLLVPTWFGESMADWVAMQDKMGLFFQATLIPEVVEKLLEVENSPEYWYEVSPWPYPDQVYYEKMTGFMDDNVPEYWTLEVRMFWFAWCVKHLQMLVMQYLKPVYLEKLQQQ